MSRSLRAAAGRAFRAVLLTLLCRAQWKIMVELFFFTVRDVGIDDFGSCFYIFEIFCRVLFLSFHSNMPEISRAF